MTKRPEDQKKYLLTELQKYSRFKLMKMKGKINRVNMEGIEPPYILLCNHSSFLDFYVMLDAVRTHKINFPAAVSDYLGIKPFLDRLGCSPKRRFISDLATIKQCAHALNHGRIYGIYVEARFCLCGTTEVIPKSVAQLVKSSNVPVVTLTCRGNHLYQPFWGDRKKRNVKNIVADMTLAYDREELKNHSVEEIHERICSLLYNDDFRWQSENRVEVKYKKRAEGLHRVLYQCPKCMTEFEMDSEGDRIFCRHCKKEWTLNIYGELEAVEGETEFIYPSDWYKWEREQVRKEVENGTYHFESDVDVNDLPNHKGFVHMGRGHLVHDMTGFHLKGVREYDNKEFEMNVNSAEQYAVHIEFNYRYGSNRDCIDLNTLDDTWYVFPEKSNYSLTKVSLATEEIYNHIWKDN